MSSRKKRCKHKFLYCGALLAVAFFVMSCSAPRTFQQQVYKMQGLGGDEREGMAKQAAYLAGGEPTALWRTDLGYLEVDMILDLPGFGVLVGLVGAGEKFGNSYYGPYVLFDEATGREMWRYGRDKNVNYLYEVLPIGATLLITRDKTSGEETQFTALNATNGAVLWQTSTKGPHTIAVGDDHLVLAHPVKDGSQIRALSLSDGSVTWTNTIPGEEHISVMAFVGSELIAVGKEINALDEVGGNVHWRVKLKSPLGTWSNITWLEDSFVVPSEDGHLTRIKHDGRVLWEASLNMRPGILQANTTRIVVQLQQAAEQSLVSLSLNTGEKEWAQRLSGSLSSEVLLHDNGYVTFTTQERDRLNFNVLASSDGTPISSATIDTNLHGPKAADRLMAVGDRVIVTGETWVGAFSLPGGRLLWRRPISSDMTVSRAIMNLRNAMTSDALSTNNESNKLTEAAFDHMESSLQQRQLLKAALRQQNAALAASEAATLGAQRWSAVQRNAYAMPAGARMVSAASDVMISQYEFAQKGGAIAAAARFPIELAAAERMQANSVHGRYVVRGYRIHSGLGKRWGVRVVDIETGRWTDIITSPHEYAYTGDTSVFNSSGLLHAELTANNRIIVKGLGLNVEQWRPMQLGPYKVVEPALLAYDLDSGTLKNPDMEVTFDGCGFVNEEGRFVIPPVYDQAYDFSDGRAPVRLDNNKWTIIDRQGKQYVEPGYGRILPFSEGLAAFQYKDNLAGFYDTDGKIVIEPALNWSPGDENMWWPYEGAPHGSAGYSFSENMRRAQATTEMYPDFYRFKNGRAVVKVETGWTIIDRAGRFLVPPGKYEQISGIYEGFAVVFRNGLWGYIDANGQEVITPQFERAGPFSEGLAGVTKAGRKLYIRPEGSTVLDLGVVYEETGRFRNGRIRVKQGKNHGFIDLKGNVIVPLVYRDAFAFSEGLAQAFFVREGERYGKWGYIDPEGKVVVDFQFSWAEPFSNGFAKVEFPDLKQRYIRKDGQYAFEGNFHMVESFTKDGLAKVKMSEKHWVKVVSAAALDEIKRQ